MVVLPPLFTRKTIYETFFLLSLNQVPSEKGFSLKGEKKTHKKTTAIAPKMSNPENTQRPNNVVTTSLQRHDVAATL